MQHFFNVNYVKCPRNNVTLFCAFVVEVEVLVVVVVVVSSFISNFQISAASL